MIKLGIDVDAVLRNWAKSFNNTYKKVFPHHSSLIKSDKEWVQLDSLEYDNLGLEKFLELYSKEIYLNGEVLPNVKETLIWLKEIGKILNIKIIIVSKQSLPIERNSTAVWLKKHDLLCNNVVFTTHFKDKWKYVDIMIDDSVDVLNAKPKNKISIKVLMPYNKDVKSDLEIDSFGTLTPEHLFLALKKLKV